MRSLLLVLLGLVVGAAVVWFVLRRPAPSEPPSPPEPEPARGFVYVPSELKPLDPTRVTVDQALQTEVVGDQLLVALADGVDEAAFAAAMQRQALPVRIVGRLPSVRTLQVEVPPARRREVQRALEQDGRLVASAGFNFVWRAFKTFDDPFLRTADEDDWGLRRIGAFAAWDLTTGGPLVAVLDSGAALDHEELVGKAVDPYSYATRSATMQRKSDVDEYGQLVYVTGHGTHVAVTIAGHAGNGRGTAGVAPASAYMPIQVLYQRPGNIQPVGDTTEIVDGMLRAIGGGAVAINMSLGAAPSPEAHRTYQLGTPEERRRLDEALTEAAREALKGYARALDVAQAQRVIVVKAAGNHSVPARWDALCSSGRVIGVAATDSRDRRAHFNDLPDGRTTGSNYGPGTTVSAPGRDIWSGYPSPDGYTSMSGTSMAAPHVAGVVALLKSRKPDLTFEEVRDILVATGTPLVTDYAIGPLVNAPAALAELERRVREGVPPPPPLPPLEPTPGLPVDPLPDPDPIVPPRPDPVPGPDPIVPPRPDPVPDPDPIVPPRPDPVPGPDPVVPPPRTDVPPRPPTYEEILKGPRPWEHPLVEGRIDRWLATATPTASLVNPDGGPWRFDMYGRAIGARFVVRTSPPDWAGYRYRWLWENARKLASTNLGTLYEYLHGLPYTVPAPPPPAPGGGGPPQPATAAVPDVSGLGRGDAEARLRRAGFDVRVAVGRPAATRDLVGTVQETVPAAGIRSRKGSVVTLRLFGDMPAPQEEPVSAYFLVCRVYFPSNPPKRDPEMTAEAYLRTVDVRRLEYEAQEDRVVLHVSRTAARVYARSRYESGHRFSVPLVVDFTEEDRSPRTLPMALLLEVETTTDTLQAALARAPNLKSEGDAGSLFRQVIAVAGADGGFELRDEESHATARGLAPVAGWPPEQVMKLIEYFARLFE